MGWVLRFGGGWLLSGVGDAGHLFYKHHSKSSECLLERICFFAVHMSELSLLDHYLTVTQSVASSLTSSLKIDKLFEKSVLMVIDLQYLSPDHFFISYDWYSPLSLYC